MVELRDPESCAQVTGLLQPVTSACAVLSIVKTEMLLMIEKLLLRQRTRGPTLVLRDVSVNEATSPVTLPVELFENATLSSSGLHKASVPLHSGSSCKHPKGSIVDSFIR